MKKVCAWCGETISYGSGASIKVTHGICQKCADKLLSHFTESTDAFLNKLEYPVVSVNQEGKVLAANDTARKVISGEVDGSLGPFRGNVMECVYTDLPGGCLKEVHCNGCEIRRSVVHTFETGESRENLLAYLDQKSPKGVVRTWYRISTRKSGKVVELFINPEPEGKELLAEAV